MPVSSTTKAGVPAAPLSLTSLKTQLEREREGVRGKVRERGEMAALGQTSCLQAASDKRPACLLHIRIHKTVVEYATDTWQGPSLQR